ncbi:ATP-binding protein [Gordonia sp. GN26]
MKDRGFASLAECEAVVHQLAEVVGAEPTAVIYSGHGLQPIWRVEDAQPITDGAVGWNTMSARWSGLVREVAKRVNPLATVDSVFNIDRVLRCPGSTNWKDPANPVRVRCEVNPDAGGVSVAALDARLPQTDAAVSAALAKASVTDGQRLRESFRDGDMTDRVAGWVDEVVAAVDSGANRHPTVNSALMGIVRLGSKGQRGVGTAIEVIEAKFAEARQRGVDPAELERSLDGALRKVAGDPDYRPLDYRGSELFGPDGLPDPNTPFGRGLAESRKQWSSSPARGERVRYEAVPASALSGPIPPMQWLIKGVWALNSFGPLGGEKKTLKSYNLLSMSVAVASGLPFYGEFEVAHPGPVLYFAGEGGRDEHQRRLQSIARSYDVPLDDLPLHTVFDTGGLDDPEFLNALARHLDALQPRLVVLDPLYAYHARGIEAQNLYDRGRMLSDFNARVGSETSLIIADHFNKTGKGDLDLDSIAQAGMSQWADSWMLQRHREPPDMDAGRFRLAVQFGSRRWGGREWNLDWDLPTAEAMERGEAGDVSWSIARANSGHTLPGSKATITGRTASRALQVLRDEPPFSLTRTGLAEKLGGNKEKTAAVVRQLIACGRIVSKHAEWPERQRDGSEKPKVRERLGLGDGINFTVKTGRE